MVPPTPVLAPTRGKIDLVGLRFGHWIVLGIHPERHRGAIRWLCRCDCGEQRLVRGDGLRKGISTSCGCVRREEFIKRNTKHGMTGTRAYICWQSLKQRCNNPNHRWYSEYGGRGIRVCSRWQTSFENFYADVGDPPEGMSIDRIYNHGDYEKRNCKWATSSQQRRNQRKKRKRKA